MEGEFESEIARRVAGRKSHKPHGRMGALLAVATAFALLSGTAAYALAMKPVPTGNQPMTEYVLFDREQDRYLADDETTAALRVMNLKVKGDHDTAGDSCMLQNAKFNYVLRVAIYNESIDWAGMELGNLTLPAGYTIDSTSAVVFDPQLTPVDIDASNAYVNDVDGVLTVSAPSLVDGAYGVGYIVAISVALGTEVDLSDDLCGALVTEIAWGDAGTLRTVTIP